MPRPSSYVVRVSPVAWICKVGTLLSMSIRVGASLRQNAHGMIVLCVPAKIG